MPTERVDASHTSREGDVNEMEPLTQILAATDFFARAMRAVDRAARLAHEHKATLHLVHVVDHLLLRMFAGDVDEHPVATELRLMDSERGRLTELARLMASHFSITVLPVLLVGRVHAEVARYAAEHSIELSVLGAQGENFVRATLIGSSASRYVRVGLQPTLVVRSEDKQPYRSVLVALDFSPASKRALATAIALAPKATLRVLHVCELPLASRLPAKFRNKDTMASFRATSEKQARTRLEAFLRDMPGAGSVTTAVQSGPAAKTIMRHARAQHCDLLALGKRGAFELNQLLLGSVSLRLFEQFEGDLLLVPSDDQGA